jgi:sensor histidine kinase YesM
MVDKPRPVANGEPSSPGARLRQGLRREAIFVAALCCTIAAGLTALFGGGLGKNLVYSFAIGLTCWSMTGFTRLVAAWAMERWRETRGRGTGAGMAAAMESCDLRLGWRGMVPLALLATLAGPPLGLWMGDALTGGQSPSLLSFESEATRVTLTITVIATLAATFVLTMLERLASASAQAEQASRLAAQTELRLLQAQLEPHMLFNTLANLRVLIAVDAPRAQTMLDHLIAFLRSTLQSSRVAEHALATEFERVADYLALMGVRMGARLEVVLDLPETLRALPVPALLLQPLVENSIQHGLEPRVEGGRIEVRARRTDDALLLTVRDTGAGLPATCAAALAELPATGGFGLTQVRERLHVLFAGQASLTLAPAADANGGTLATLRLPLRP